MMLQYNPFELALSRGIDVLVEENEKLLVKLLSFDFYQERLQAALENLSAWELERDNPKVKRYFDFFENELLHGDVRLRDVYGFFYQAAISKLDRKIDICFANLVFQPITIQEIQELPQGTLIRLVAEHILVGIHHAMSSTREELTAELPWFEGLYEALYKWCKRNRPSLLRLPPYFTPQVFEIAPTFYQAPIQVIENKPTVSDAKKTSVDLGKAEKRKAKQKEEQELAKLLQEIGGSDKSTSGAGSGTKKKKKKQAVASKAVDETPVEEQFERGAQAADTHDEEGMQEPLKPFSDHSGKPVRHAKRVADWFRRPQQALVLQGYNVPGSFRNRLLQEQGAERIVENHKFPQVIDHHLLHSPHANIIQQADGSFRVTLPGYRTKMIEGVPVKEFGIFEVAYNVEPNGTRKVYHRFFRPVANHRVLMGEFGLSQGEGQLIDMPDEQSSAEYDDSWTTTGEQEGWAFEERAPGLFSIRRPHDTTSYGLLEIQ